MLGTISYVPSIPENRLVVACKQGENNNLTTFTVTVNSHSLERRRSHPPTC